MAQKKLIKDLRDSKNIDILQTLKSFVYGNRELRVYKDGLSYKYRAIVIKFVEEYNRFMTFRCKVPNSSETWNDDEWQLETAMNTLFTIEDKLIINSETQPTDIENKLWYKTIRDNGNGTKNVSTMHKNKNGEYEKLYSTTVTDNIYLDNEETTSLKDKLALDDEEFKRVRIGYLSDILNVNDDLNIFIKSTDVKFINIIDVCELIQDGEKVTSPFVEI